VTRRADPPRLLALLALVAGALLLAPRASRAQERAEALPAPGQEQTPAALEPTSPEDRIMAIVGDQLLLESEWREQTTLIADQAGISTGPELRALGRRTFDQMVQELVIVAAAQRDTSIQVDAERVNEAADEELDRIRQRFPSEEAFQRELANSQWGSLAAYRADLQERKRRELLGQEFLDARRPQIRPRPVSDEEVRRYWDENKAQFGKRPEAYRFEEIPVLTEPGAEERERARAEAQRIKDEIAAGRDFAAAARQYSDDTGSADQGGDLGWFGRGRMVPAFEDAAFSSPAGDLEGPIETDFGFHILQVLEKRGDDEVHARHILVAFKRDESDRLRAQERAEEIRAAIAAGADVDSLQAAVMPGDSAAADVIEVSRGQLPQSYADKLDATESGQPTIVETPTGFSVLVDRGMTGGDEIEFDEIEPRLRQQLAQQKAEEAFVQRLKEDVYVDVRETPEQALDRLASRAPG